MSQPALSMSEVEVEKDRFWSRLAWAGVGAVVVMAVCYAWVDQPVARWVDTLPGRVRALARQASLLGEAPVYLVPLALGFLIARKKGWKTGAERCLYLFLAVAAAGIFVHVPKVLMGRYRPRFLLERGDYGFSWLSWTPEHYEKTSIPSGHATVMFALGAGLWCLYPRWRWVWVAGATVISLGRVLSNNHFVGDVVAGAYLGAGCALVIARIMAGRGRLAVNLSPGRV
ncbi:MAG: phosphatase PAP2 family protein [Phycisphaeraceae bacterium]|nr:phosphatase PAP2 family protein [Phycisphaeraceae bacterium]